MENKTAKKQTNSARRLNKLAQALDAQTYLEVGVQTGGTFLAIDIADKTGVDPKFLFDTAPHVTDTVRLHETTSDDFFSHIAPMGKTYDIIFLDGLHEAHQTFRDFCSSQAVAHDRTVWIIDDTIPSDIFSSNPDNRLAVATRKQHGLQGGAWHGDVYKVIPAIDFLFNNMKFFTFYNGAHPQTAVWRSHREGRRFDYASMEEIFRTDYYGFMEIRDRFDLVSDENAGIERVVAALGDRPRHAS